MSDGAIEVDIYSLATCNILETHHLRAVPRAGEWVHLDDRSVARVEQVLWDGINTGHGTNAMVFVGKPKPHPMKDGWSSTHERGDE